MKPLLVLPDLALFLLLPLALLLGDCSKKNTVPTIDFGPNDGISYRNASNIPLGTQDPTDWTIDGDWNAQEQNLFTSLRANLNTSPQGSATYIGGAFPNPATNAVRFEYQTPGTALSKIVFVDNNYQVMATFDGPTTASTSYSITINLNNGNYKKGQRYRLYYVLYNGTALYFKGHGDIRVE